MIHVAVRIRELVSSNVDTIVDQASNPAKMLRLLRTEIEESLISLHGNLSRARRQEDRLSDATRIAAEEAEQWTSKAKTAIDHKREDLARSALLAREDGRARAKALEEEVVKVGTAIKEIEQAIADLESKREEANARLAAIPSSGTSSSQVSACDSKAERHLDRIDRIERRVGFANDGVAEPALASIDAEIAALQRDADIHAELASMKSSSRPKPKRKKAK